MRYVQSEDTLWPAVPGDLENLEWRLRYAETVSKVEALAAASVVAAYRELVLLPQRERNRRIADIRLEHDVLRAAPDTGEAGPATPPQRGKP